MLRTPAAAAGRLFRSTGAGAVARSATSARASVRAASTFSRISPKSVLKYSGQSVVGTVIALGAVALYVQPEWRREAADETAHLVTSGELGNQLIDNRARAYRVLAKLPQDYVVEKPTGAAALGANDEPEKSVIRLKAFGSEFQVDLGNLEAMVQKAKDGVNEQIDKTLDPKVVRVVKEKVPVDTSDRLPFVRPTFDQRATAWLIDSAFVGLLASPFWGVPLYGAITSVTWLLKDYILAPWGYSSPGCHLMGLEKVHLPTAQALRPAKAGDAPGNVDSATIFKSEHLSILGHNTLRFMTWCSSLGPVSSLATLLWVGYATLNGVEETMEAWDKFTGVQLVHRADLEAFESTGKVPYRARPKASFNLNLEMDSSSTAKEVTTSVDVNDSKLELGVEVVPNGKDGSPAKLKITQKQNGQVTVKEMELPGFVTISESKSS
ncbi:hypothetical protein GGF31_006588 [Allomyces arbusculus]|nr:hypothetical protein GGF31_006588 [Allomyces arbusculus]